MKIAIIGFIILAIAGIYFTAPSESDIQKCVETSNMSYETCLWALKG